MKAPTISFHTGRLECLLCHKDMPLPESANVMERAFPCGVVARLVSIGTAEANWRIGKSVQPREGYRTILPHRRTTDGGSHVIFEQPIPARRGDDRRR